MVVASSSVAQVTTRMDSSLSSAASTDFWCVSGTLRIQPRWLCRGGSRTSAASAARAARKVSFSVSMMSGAGIDSGIGDSSEPARFVDHVAQGLPGQEAPAVVEQDLVAALVEIGPMAGGVWRDQHARHGPQGVVGRQRLLLEDVETRARDL